MSESSFGWERLDAVHQWLVAHPHIRQVAWIGLDLADVDELGVERADVAADVLQDWELDLVVPDQAPARDAEDPALVHDEVARRQKEAATDDKGSSRPQVPEGAVHRDGRGGKRLEYFDH